MKSAGDFVRQTEFSVNDVVKPGFHNVLARAEERVVEAFTKGRVSDKTDQDRDVEWLSFPVALMLVRLMKLDHVIRVYALAEARRSEIALRQERVQGVEDEIFQNNFSIKLERITKNANPYYKIGISDYVKRAVHFHKSEWKLVNRIVDRGEVTLPRDDLIRLIREEVQELIVSRLQSINPPKVPPELDQTVKRLIQLAPPPPRSAYTIINVKPEDYPPCVREALNLLEKGQNVPHYGRFLMATYLLAVGKSVDDIMALFPKAPDFKASVTKYQVEHIAGLKGGRTRYSVPSCKTLQTHSFCFKDPVKCYEISTPLQYPSRKRPEEPKEQPKKKRESQSRSKTKSQTEERRDWKKTR